MIKETDFGNVPGVMFRKNQSIYYGIGIYMIK